MRNWRSFAVVVVMLVAMLLMAANIVVSMAEA